MQEGFGRAGAQVGRRADDLHQQAEGLQVELGAEHLDGGGGADVEGMALGGAPRHLPVDEAQELEARPDPGQVELGPLLVDHPAAVGQLGVLGEAEGLLVGLLQHPRRAEGDPLVVELVGYEGPAVVLAADEVRGGHPHVLVEDLVDVVLAHQVHRLDGDAGRVHRHDDHRDALVLGHVGVGAHGQPAVVGVAGQAGEDLLAVDDVFVTVEDGLGLERGQVGAGAGLGVADAEVDLAPQDLGEEPLLLLLGAVAEDGGTDRVDGQHRHRGAGPHRLVEEDELVELGLALAAVLRRPADAEPAVGAHLLDDLAHRRADAVGADEGLLHLRRQQLGVVVPQLLAQGLLFLVIADVHPCPPRK